MSILFQCILNPIKSMVAWCREYSRVPVILGGAGYSIFPQVVLVFLGKGLHIQTEMG